MSLEELRAILAEPDLDLCVEIPVPDDRSSWTEEHKVELAKALHDRGVRAREEGDSTCALSLLEEAYFLVPGKHRFAFVVGELAATVGDCVKARDYLEHYLLYSDGKRPEWEQRARELLETPELRKCERPPPPPDDSYPEVCLQFAPEPEPEPLTKPFKPQNAEERRFDRYMKRTNKRLERQRRR